MTSITISLSDSEYAEVISKKGTRTHREVYLDALGIKCEKRPMGRPTADEIKKRQAEEYEMRARKIYTDRIAEYNKLHPASPQWDPHSEAYNKDIKEKLKKMRAEG